MYVTLKSRHRRVAVAVWWRPCAQRAMQAVSSCRLWVKLHQILSECIQTLGSLQIFFASIYCAFRCKDIRAGDARSLSSRSVTVFHISAACGQCRRPFPRLWVAVKPSENRQFSVHVLVGANPQITDVHFQIWLSSEQVWLSDLRGRRSK